MIKKYTLTALTLALAGTMFFGFAPRPAQADTNSTIAIAAAAIAGVLLFDANNHPYYVRGYQRVYVSNDVANYYVQQRDPGRYSNHRGDWQGNRNQFSNDWNRDHNGNGYGNGDRGNGRWHGDGGRGH